MAGELKDYQSVDGFNVQARQLTEDMYFHNRMAHKGDWLIYWMLDEYLIPEELFPKLFERKYCCLEEACQEGAQDA